MEHMHGAAGGTAVWWVFGIVGCIIVAGIIYLIFKPSPKQPSDLYYNTDGSAANPLEILNKRYCAGDIDKEEYERLKQDIGIPPKNG